MTPPVRSDAGTVPDVMGYHTAAEIPNYWTYARDFVLDDHMFEPVASWSLPDHLYMVSAWSARCANSSPSSCVNAIVGPYGVAQMDQAVYTELETGVASYDFAWTDITWLLYAHHVSWAYYIQTGTQPDCDDDNAETCAPIPQRYSTPGIWNPLPLFGDVRQDHQLGNIQSLNEYFTRRQGRNVAGRQLDHAVGPGQRAPAGQRPPRPGLRHRDHQRRHEEPGLELDGDLPLLGRLGRLLRQRRPAEGRRERLRPTGPVHRDLPVREERFRRSPDAEQRRLPQVHRRRLSERRSAQPEDRRSAGPAPRCPRGRTDPRQPGQGLRLQPGSETSASSLPTNPPTDSPSIPAFFKTAPPCTDALRCRRLRVLGEG